MTSGVFHRIPINDIRVIRDQRQRKELTKIEVLADSIRRLGLINPITVTRNGELIAGERRLAAIKMLKWDYAIVQYVDELDDLTKRAIELEENIKRVDLTWQEQYAAVTEYNDIGKIRKGNSWNQEKTAEGLGLSEATVSQYLEIENEVKRGNATLLKQPNYSTARGIIERNADRRATSALEELRDAKDSDESIINADFTEWIKTYVGPKFNFIHCDFPYGIGANERHQGHTHVIHGEYDDSPETYFHLLGVLCSNLDRICTESAHIMFWFSMHYYHDTLEFFSSHSDFIIDPFPLVWMKTDNIGLLPDPQRGPRRIYETCLFGNRGDRKIVSSVSNAYGAPTDRTTHMSAKPEPVLRHFFRMFVDENSVVLDPTCGAGSALRAAESLGAAHILGIEINRDFTERADLMLRASRRMKHDSGGGDLRSQDGRLHEQTAGEAMPNLQSESR